MTAPAATLEPAVGSPATAAPRPAGVIGRARVVIAGIGAAVLGAAPHVLHHVGPLAGAAVLAGATGKLLFGAVGFVLAIPMLRQLHRRAGSWAVPGGVLRPDGDRVHDLGVRHRPGRHRRQRVGHAEPERARPGGAGDRTVGREPVRTRGSSPL